MFQGFTVEHMQNRTVLYPYGKEHKVECIYLEEDGSYLAHKKSGNKLGRLEKKRGEYSLAELQELCFLIVEKPK